MKPPLDRSSTATRRPNDRRYIIPIHRLPTCAEVHQGFATHNQRGWRARLVMYGVDRADAMQRANLEANEMQPC